MPGDEVASAVKKGSPRLKELVPWVWYSLHILPGALFSEMETEDLETLKKYISQLGSTTAANISRLHLTMAGRRHSEDTHVLFKQNYSQTQVPIFKKAQVSTQHK